MSGAIAGMFSRSGAPLVFSRLERITRKLTVMAPDGSDTWRNGDVAFAYLHFDDGATQSTEFPWVDPLGYAIAIEGRIDAERLSSHDQRLAPLSLPEAILESYRNYGTRCFERLIGDFSLCIWDPAKARVVLACDALGRRPLYFSCTRDLLFWASRSRPIADEIQSRFDIDADYVASFLVNHATSRSPYAGVCPVRGGCAVIVERGGVFTERYWSLETLSELRYNNDADYEEHFRSLFLEAVRCRLPQRATTFCQLSGGLDSSSILAAADHLIKSEKNDCDVVPVSFTYSSAAGSDESKFIRSVENHLSRPGIWIDEFDHPLLAEVPLRFSPDVPANAVMFSSKFDRLLAEMECHRARVLLSGIGGDQLFWSEASPSTMLFDMLHQRQFRRFVRETYRFAAIEGSPPLTALARCASAYASGRYQAELLGRWQPPPWLDRRCSEICSQAESFADSKARPRLPSKIAQEAMIHRTMRPFALECCLREAYIDVRYPYLDRRLVEFACSLPLEQSIRFPETRSIVRRSMDRFLPDLVRLRRTKGGPDEALHRAVVRRWDRLRPYFADLRIAQRGFVDGSEFVKAIERMRHGTEVHSSVVLSALSLELWLRSLESPEESLGSRPRVPCNLVA